MAIFGLILMVAGYVFGMSFLWAFGVVIFVVGLALSLAGHFDSPIGGRRYWY